MSDTRTILRRLHELHQRVRDVRGEAEQGPRQLRRYQAKIDHQQKALNDAQEAVKHLKVTIHEKEVTLKANLSKIERHQQQMNQASTRKEYDALRTEIDHEKQGNRVLEDEILEAMAALEEKAAQLLTLEKALELAKNGYQKAEQELAGKGSHLEERLAESHSTLKATEAELPANVREVYDRLVHARGADALAAVEGQTCAGCYTEITPQGYQELRAGKIVACKSCGRLLYLPE